MPPKHINKLPDWAEDHPQALKWRVEQVENILEDHLQYHQSSSDTRESWLPLIAQACLWILGFIMFKSPEQVIEFVQLFSR